MIASHFGRLVADLDYNGAPALEDCLEVEHVLDSTWGLPLCGADGGDDMPASGLALECPGCAALVDEGVEA